MLNEPVYPVGTRIVMTENYWRENRGERGCVTGLMECPLDGSLGMLVTLDGDDMEYPMPVSVLRPERVN